MVGYCIVEMSNIAILGHLYCCDIAMSNVALFQYCILDIFVILHCCDVKCCVICIVAILHCQKSILQCICELMHACDIELLQCLFFY